MDHFHRLQMADPGFRNQCHLSRDAFYNCLRKEAERNEACAEAFRNYTRSCPESWRDFYDRQHK